MNRRKSLIGKRITTSNFYPILPAPILGSQEEVALKWMKDLVEQNSSSFSKDTTSFIKKQQQFQSAVIDGVILCEIANLIQKNIIPKIHINARKFPFNALENFKYFRIACTTTFAFDERFIPEAEEFRDYNDRNKIFICFKLLAKYAAKNGISPVLDIPNDPSSNAISRALGEKEVKTTNRSSFTSTTLPDIPEEASSSNSSTNDSTETQSSESSNSATPPVVKRSRRRVAFSNTSPTKSDSAVQSVLQQKQSEKSTNDSNETLVSDKTKDEASKDDGDGYDEYEEYGETAPVVIADDTDNAPKEKTTPPQLDQANQVPSPKTKQRPRSTKRVIRQTVIHANTGSQDGDATSAENANESMEKERLEKEKLEKERIEKERLEKERLEKERLEKERIEKERIEKERLEKERIEKERLEKERQEKERLEKERIEKEKLEKERIEKERLEKERLEKERIEKERLEKERLEKERIEKEKLEKERIEKERLEKERLEKERVEKERIEKERLEKERLEKERIEKERLEKERLEKERLEKERIEKEKLEKERIEKERLEKERIEKERIEKERIEKEKLEKERIEKEKLEKEKLEKERIEKERLEKERLEKERLEKERLEKERLKKERLEKERLEKERLEKERLEKERLEKERLEKERIEKEKLEKERIEKEKLEKERLEKQKVENEKLRNETSIAIKNKNVNHLNTAIKKIEKCEEIPIEDETKRLLHEAKSLVGRLEKISEKEHTLEQFIKTLDRSMTNEDFIGECEMDIDIASEQYKNLVQKAKELRNQQEKALALSQKIVESDIKTALDAFISENKTILPDDDLQNIISSWKKSRKDQLIFSVQRAMRFKDVAELQKLLNSFYEGSRDGSVYESNDQELSAFISKAENFIKDQEQFSQKKKVQLMKQTLSQLTQQKEYKQLNNLITGLAPYMTTELSQEIEQAKNYIKKYEDAIKEQQELMKSTSVKSFLKYQQVHKDILPAKEFELIKLEWENQCRESMLQKLKKVISEEIDEDVEDVAEMYTSYNEHSLLMNDEKINNLISAAKDMAKRKEEAANALEKAMEIRDKEAIQDAIQKGSQFKSLEEEVKGVEKILSKIIAKEDAIKNQLKKAIESNNPVAIQKSIEVADLSGVTCGEALEEAKKVLEKLRAEKGLIDNLEAKMKEAIESRSIQLLRNDTFEEAEKYGNLKLLRIKIMNIIEEQDKLLKEANDQLIPNGHESSQIIEWKRKASEVLPASEIEEILNKWSDARLRVFTESLNEAEQKEDFEKVLVLCNDYDKKLKDGVIRDKQKIEIVSDDVKKAFAFVKHIRSTKSQLEKGISERDKNILVKSVKSGKKYTSLGSLVEQANTIIVEIEKHEQLSAILKKAISTPVISDLEDAIEKAEDSKIASLSPIIQVAKDKLAAIAKEQNKQSYIFLRNKASSSQQQQQQQRQEQRNQDTLSNEQMIQSGSETPKEEQSANLQTISQKKEETFRREKQEVANHSLPEEKGTPKNKFQTTQEIPKSDLQESQNTGEESKKSTKVTIAASQSKAQKKKKKKDAKEKEDSNNGGRATSPSKSSKSPKQTDGTEKLEKSSDGPILNTLPIDSLNPLVAALAKSLTSVIESAVVERNSLVITRENPSYETFLGDVCALLSDGLKKKYIFFQRTIYDLFSFSPFVEIDKTLEHFNNEIVKQNNPGQRTQSELLLEFLMDQRVLSRYIAFIMKDMAYLYETYEEGAVLKNATELENIKTIVNEMNKLRFELGFPIVLFPKFMWRLKKCVDQIVQHKNDGRVVNDLVNKEFIPILECILTYDIKTVPILKKSKYSILYHIWDVIEFEGSMISEIDDPLNQDQSKVSLSSAIEAVNDIMKDEQISVDQGSSNSLKFKLFVAYSVNHHRLGNFIRNMIFESRSKRILAMFFHQSSPLLKKKNQIQLLSELDRLSNLFIQLPLNVTPLLPVNHHHTSS